MKMRLVDLAHLAVLGIESLALVGLLAWMMMLAFRPVGWTSTDDGDVLRFRFQPGQDEAISNCVRVQVVFVTKEFPRMFENPQLTIRKQLVPDDPYAWIEIPAPVGTHGFRFDVHPVKGVTSLEHSPEVAEMYLGQQELSWPEIKSHYQFDKVWHVPCYLYLPEYFLNLSWKQIFWFSMIYMLTFFVAIGMVVGVKKRKGGTLP